MTTYLINRTEHKAAMLTLKLYYRELSQHVEYRRPEHCDAFTSPVTNNERFTQSSATDITDNRHA